MKYQFTIKTVILLTNLFVTVFSFAQCNPPTGVVVNNITSISAVLNWTASSSAPGEAYLYEVRTSGLPGSGVSGLVVSGSVGDGVFSSLLSGLSSITTYSVYMRYKCTSAPLFSSWTAAVTFSTNTLLPPVAASASGISDTFFTARWIGVSGATGYRLDVSEFSDFSVLLAGYNNLFVASSFTSKLVSGLNPSTVYYYRVRAEGLSGGTPVTTSNSNVITVTTLGVPNLVAIWSNGAWLNGVLPAFDHDVILDDDYVSDSNNMDMFEVKSLTLNQGHTYTIASGFNLIVYENIVNNSSAASFVVENNANLYQLSDSAPANVGEITVLRNSSEIFRLDYTMWSSPVTGAQTLKQFSPSTLDTRFYEYNTVSNHFSSIDPLTSTFEPGNGYFIRAPNNHVANVSPNVAQAWQGTFVGVPRNGVINVDLDTSGQGYNLVGNPYPTVISADALFVENASNIDGTLYFWRRRNDTSGAGDLGTFYATYTGMGGTGSATSEDPNGFIQVGQGFLVKALTTQLVFNSDMKVPDSFENQFFRNSSAVSQVEKHRLWLNLTNENGVYSRMLVGYAQGASNNLDRLDGKCFNDSQVALTSLLNNEEYSIQAKSLPFSTEDTIPLGLKVVAAGAYSISLDEMDGLFEEGQLVYLEDTFTSTIHNLNESDYTFSTGAGIFNNRFVLRFSTESLGIDEPLNANAVAVFVSNNSIIINSVNIDIKSINVYDIQGRKLFNQDAVNSNEFRIDTLTKNNQVLIVKIKDQNGNLISKKVIF
ncbi:MAG: T9SS type A sorting domain-containing protein [Flavobacterium sp.]|nr:T9SS type A sorting domain-containing protein [Flavobacterium sp.]